MSSVRLRLTLFYALLLAAACAVVLGASYLLIRGHLYDTLDATLAHQAVSALASQYALALLAVVLIAAGGGWLVSGEVLAPIERAPYYALALFPGDIGTAAGLIPSIARRCFVASRLTCSDEASRSLSS